MPFDAVAIDLPAHVPHVGAHHLVEPGHQRRDFGPGQLVAGSGCQRRRVGTQPAHLQRALAQRLAGDRSAVHAGAADTGFLLDHDDVASSLDRRDGRLLAGGTAANHQKVAATGV